MFNIFIRKSLKALPLLGVVVLTGCTQLKAPEQKGGVCVTQSQCLEDQLCVEGWCRATCNADRPCRVGETCLEEGYCKNLTAQSCHQSEECHEPGECEEEPGQCVQGICMYTVIEGCWGSCVPGSFILCTTLPPEEARLKAGVGACTLGKRFCREDGTFSAECIGAGVSRPEGDTPDGIDNDCDGSVDEGLPCDPRSFPTEGRSCHRGLIDLEAERLALGICAKDNQPYVTRGRQYCLAKGVLGTCMGDQWPHRAEQGLGWEEAACNGLDEDCDGVPDNHPDFDRDHDGYTICGTPLDAMAKSKACREQADRDPETKQDCWGPHPVTLRVEEADCDDDNPNSNPGRKEICGNKVDEDCRCDHGDEQGKLSLLVAPSKPGEMPQYRCQPADHYLDCSRNVTCENHYFGIASYKCYEKVDPDANKACRTDGACFSADDICPGETEPKSTESQGRHKCYLTRADTCHDTIPPTYEKAPAGTIIDDCEPHQACDGKGECKLKYGERCKTSEECAGYGETSPTCTSRELCCRVGVNCGNYSCDEMGVCYLSCEIANESQTCHPDYYCDESVPNCKQRLDTGVACSRPRQCQSGICKGGTCKLANGEACTFDVQCESGFCQSSDESTVCSQTFGIGNACERDAACESSFCQSFGDFSVCNQRVGTGESCESNAACLSGYCRIAWPDRMYCAQDEESCVLLGSEGNVRQYSKGEQVCSRDDEGHEVAIMCQNGGWVSSTCDEGCFAGVCL